jgi:hypothetical protein
MSGKHLAAISSRADVIKTAEDAKVPEEHLQGLKFLQRRDAQVLERVQKTMRNLS